MRLDTRELTPEEFHNEIMWALTEYPSFKFWEFRHHSRPKRYNTLAEIRSYWEDEEILWVKGYYRFLSPKALELFKIDQPTNKEEA